MEKEMGRKGEKECRKYISVNISFENNWRIIERNQWTIFDLLLKNTMIYFIWIFKWSLNIAVYNVLPCVKVLSTFGYIKSWTHALHDLGKTGGDSQ